MRDAACLPPPWSHSDTQHREQAADCAFRRRSEAMAGQVSLWMDCVIQRLSSLRSHSPACPVVARRRRIGVAQLWIGRQRWQRASRDLTKGGMQNRTATTRRSRSKEATSSSSSCSTTSCFRSTRRPKQAFCDSRAVGGIASENPTTKAGIAGSAGSVASPPNGGSFTKSTAIYCSTHPPTREHSVSEAYSLSHFRWDGSPLASQFPVVGIFYSICEIRHLSVMLLHGSLQSDGRPNHALQPTPLARRGSALDR